MLTRRIVPMVLAVGALAVVLLVAWPATAQTSPPTTMLSEEDGGRMTCDTTGPPYSTTPSGEEIRPKVCEFRAPAPTYRQSPAVLRPLLGLLFFIFLPVGLAAAVADRRDESVFIAAILAVLLSWIGFVLVYSFLGRRRRRPDDAAPLGT